MKPEGNQNEIADLPGQNLPGRIVHVNERPRTARLATGNFTSMTWAREIPEQAYYAAAALGSTCSLGERLERLIVDEIKAVTEQKLNGIAAALTLKPGTEVLLQVRVDHSWIEAELQCEPNDFETLNAHWARLERMLAGRGVQLLPLVRQPNLPPNLVPRRQPTPLLLPGI